jgi:hypothetical protein
MKSKAILAALTILLAFPAGLRAQQAGFVVGIGSRQARSAQQGRIQQGRMQTGRIQQGRNGVVRTQPSQRVRVNGNVTPRGAAFPPRGAVLPQRGTAFPQRGRDFPQRGMNFPRSSVVFVGPAGVKNAPGHEPRTPTHPVVAPGVTVITPGTGRVFTNGRRGTPFAIQSGVRIIQPEIGSAIAVRARNRYSSYPPVVSVGNIVRGTSRDAVIARFGRPKVQIINRNSETMIFGGTTIIIENGIVALIR